MIEHACQAAMWTTDPPLVERRFERALTAQHLSVRTRAVRLEAWLTRDADVVVRVNVMDEWDEEQENRLRALIDRSDSPLAEVLIEHWHLVRTACAAKANSAGE
jgi:hypothetical protein